MDACEDGLEQLDVHTMWRHEAHDFTPWLAENLHMVGDAIGLKLEPVQTEVPVGPYFLDILARDADDGTSVAIENQLEVTDLHHLGQLLTYATGCEALTAIWVAPAFGYELAQALHRLNEWTKDGIRFYGVKVEVVKQAGGAPSPRFLKVVCPGCWNKEATLQSGEMSPDKLRYHEFFKPLIVELVGQGYADKALLDFDHTGRRFPSHLNPGTEYAACLDQNGAWVVLRIRMEEKAFTKSIFDALEDDREKIERSIDAGPTPDWQWLRHDHYYFSSICIRRDGSIDGSPEQLEEVRAWMLDLLPKLKEVFDPRLAGILDAQ